MRRHLATTLAALAALLLLATTPVAAISYGEIDTDPGHPNVGAIGVKVADGRWFFLCSGTLIAPDVFVTAAHCVAGLENFADQVFVTFDVNMWDADESTFFFAKEVHYDPAFLHYNQGDPHDLGVIILAEEVEGGAPATLPTAGLLDELGARGGLRNVSFVNVGYGFSRSFQGGWPHAEIDGFRRVSTSPFQGLTKSMLKQLMNHSATGEGGTCYLDSGGPKFLPGPNTIVAVQSGGDRMCRAESYAYRLDTPQARAFLGQFVDLP